MPQVGGQQLDLERKHGEQRLVRGGVGEGGDSSEEAVVVVVIKHVEALVAEEKWGREARVFGDESVGGEGGADVAGVVFLGGGSGSGGPLQAPFGDGGPVPEGGAREDKAVAASTMREGIFTSELEVDVVKGGFEICAEVEGGGSLVDEAARELSAVAGIEDEVGEDLEPFAREDLEDGALFSLALVGLLEDELQSELGASPSAWRRAPAVDSDVEAPLLRVVLRRRLG